MKTSLLLLLLVIGVVAVAEVVAMPYTGPEWFGGLRLIDNIHDPEIQELGEWAVLEHVKRTNEGLKFGKVVSGEEQPVAGTNYWLVIQALNGNGENVMYKTRVYEQLWPNTRELASFGPAN